MNKWTQDWAKAHQIPFEWIEKTGSAMDAARTQKSGELFLILCSHQSQGRGRKNHAWMDSDFMGVWSWEQNISPCPVLSSYLGWMFYKNLNLIWPKCPWSIKAPNDLFIGNQKMGGLLLEVFTEGSCSKIIVGAGMNILSHPKQATSVSKHTLIHPSEWKKFMNFLWEDFLWISKNSISFLTNKVRRDLTKAMKKNKDHKDLIEVDSSGYLIFKNKKILWDQL